MENGNFSTPPVVNSCKRRPPKSKQQVVWEDYNIVLVFFKVFLFFSHSYRPSTHLSCPKRNHPTTGQANILSDGSRYGITLDNSAPC